MRRYLILLLFALTICLTQTSEARRFALLVGVDDYEKIQPLNCCVNDMKALREALIKIGFEKDDIHMLYTGGAVRYMPTKRKIEEEVAKILDAVKSEDVVFFAFSGHGMREGTVDYFCPTFADLDNLEKTSVSITKVMNDLSKCRAKFKWMVIDACRSENVKGVKGFQVISYPPKGIVLFQSCSEGESSYEEDRKGGNGYFTKNLVAALSGKADSDHDGKLTMLEVCKWTATQTRAEVEKVENKTQRPFLNLVSSDFILTEDLNLPKAKTLIEEARNAMEAENYSLAIKKYNEAIALYPQSNVIRRERQSAQKLLEAENRIKVVEKKRKEEEERKRKEEAERKRREEVERKRKADEDRKRREEAKKHDLSIPGTVAGERKTITVNGVTFPFRWCPAGTFLMGSPEYEEGRDHYAPEAGNVERQHQVTLTKGFWMLETEVTLGMFREFVSATGYRSQGNMPMGLQNFMASEPNSKYSWRNLGFSQDDNHPVACVSWYDAAAFCNWLSKKTGQKITLPTEAQWEYACRAGSTGPYAGNIKEMVWEGDYVTHPVGSKKPNNWGIYDMHGGVIEWCADWFGDYPGRGVTDPTGPASGSERVSRSALNYSLYVTYISRSSYRRSFDPGFRSYSCGFRCLKVQ